MSIGVWMLNLEEIARIVGGQQDYFVVELEEKEWLQEQRII